MDKKNSFPLDAKNYAEARKHRRNFLRKTYTVLGLIFLLSYAIKYWFNSQPDTNEALLDFIQIAYVILNAMTALYYTVLTMVLHYQTIEVKNQD